MLPIQLPTKKDFKIQQLPVLSPCYCGECKKPLTESRVMDGDHAWCPACKKIVATSWFQVPGWTVGAVVIVYGYLFVVWQ